MSVSFDRAREIATSQCKPEWEARAGGRGTFHVADWGFEDADAFSVVVGARESIVDGQDGFTEFDARAILVDKSTGQLSRVHYLPNRARLSEMTPVGPVPADRL